MADSYSTALHRELDNIEKCQGTADFRESGGGNASSNGSAHG